MPKVEVSKKAVQGGKGWRAPLQLGGWLLRAWCAKKMTGLIDAIVSLSRSLSLSHTHAAHTLHVLSAAPQATPKCPANSMTDKSRESLARVPARPKAESRRWGDAVGHRAQI